MSDAEMSEAGIENENPWERQMEVDFNRITSEVFYFLSVLTDELEQFEYHLEILKKNYDQEEFGVLAEWEKDLVFQKGKIQSFRKRFEILADALLPNQCMDHIVQKFELHQKHYALLQARRELAYLFSSFRGFLSVTMSNSPSLKSLQSDGTQMPQATEPMSPVHLRGRHAKDDYYRFSEPVSEATDKMILEAAGHLREVREVFLLGHGMGALSVALDFARSMRLSEKVIIGKNHYFEFTTVLETKGLRTNKVDKNLFTDETVVEAAEWIEQNCQLNESTTFILDTQSVKHDLRFLNLDTLYEALKATEGKRGVINLIFDDSMLGQASDLGIFIERVKDLDNGNFLKHNMLFVVMSLVKAHSSGMDNFSGGALFWIGDSIDGVRLPPQNLKTATGAVLGRHELMQIPPTTFELQKNRLAASDLNARILAGQLQAAKLSGLPITVSHPSLPSHPDNARYQAHGLVAGPLLYVDLPTITKSTFRLEGEFNEFAKLLSRRCEEAKIPLEIGSSYGLNTTRIAYYPRSSAGGTNEGTLRVSIGNEDVGTIYLLSQIMIEAIHEFYGV